VRSGKPIRVKHHHPNEENMTGHIAGSPNVKPIPTASRRGSSSISKTVSEKTFADRVNKVPDHTARERAMHRHTKVKRRHSSEERTTARHLGSGTAGSRESRIKIWRGEESSKGRSTVPEKEVAHRVENVSDQTASSHGSSSSRTVSEKDLADRVETVGKHEARLQELEKERERGQIERDFATEIEKCTDDGLRFSGEHRPGGDYRVAGGSIYNSPRGLGNLYRLAVAAARVGEVQIVADVVRIAKESKPDFDDSQYPIWRQIYEAAYEWLDPKSPAAIALKKEYGA
jgi:hypothetical protein